jgi:hypothetical protein
MQNLRTYKKWILFIIVLTALGIATPVLADYLGPNRTVTQTVGTCKVLLYKCQYVENKKDYRYHQSSSWSCSLESKPWQAYPSNSKPCNEGQNEGYQYWEREEGSEQIVTTHPPATIAGSINCTLQNGWCRSGTDPQLALSANEPLSGQRITLIEGALNGVTFACPADATSCNIPLNQGTNDFTYWALSSWGDSSTMGSATAKVDTVPPDVGLDILGTSGTNSWYISPTTVTAAGSDATSGVAINVLTLDNVNWQPSVILNEGVHTVTVYVQDHAGNESQSSTVFSVDTTTPAIAVSVNGTVGRNGWYKAIPVQVSAVSTDAMSGIATFEVSTDGSAYQPYMPITFRDGHHTIRFKAVDHAGNQTETPLQEFYVDTLAPTVDLPSSWQLGKNVPYAALDEGSGLAALRIVIEDEDELYAKLAWDEKVSGPSYSQDIDWNGEFRDKTVAPPGTYLVWIKASDMAGNERFELGKVIVPEPKGILSLLPAEEPSVSADLPVPPAELSDPEADPLITLPPISGFGGETTESTKSSGTTPQSVVLSKGEVTSSAATNSTGILWGAAAATAIAAATAYALETTRKRKDAEAEQAAQVKAQIAHDKAERAEKQMTKEEKAKKVEAHDQKVQERKERQSWENPAQEKARLKEQEERDRAYQEQLRQQQLKNLQATYSPPPSGVSPETQQAFLHGGGKGAQNWIKNNLLQLQQAYIKQQEDAKEINRKREEAKKRADAEAKRRADAIEANRRRDDAKKRAEAEAKKAEELQTKNVVTTPAQKTWWQKTLDWVDQHESEIAFGLGVAVGVGAILLSGGLAAPLVAVAWTVGAAAVAAGTVAIGTALLNTYYGREWHENLLENIGIATLGAVVVTGGWFLLQRAMLVGGVLCTEHPAKCAIVQPVLNAWDTGEEMWLNAKLSYYLWKGDEKEAAGVAFELHSEYADGGMPGNVVAKELGDRVEDISEIAAKYGKDAADLIQKHGLPAINLLKTVNPTDAKKLLETINEDVLYDVVQEGPDAVVALSRWSLDDLSKNGLELASRAKKDAKVLAAVQKLVASGPIDPKHLTDEQQALINEIAANSTQYADEGQVVLGKWVDNSNGFVEYAKDTGSVHYNPHPDMWNLLGGLGKDKQGDVAWLINQKVIQNGIDKGLPFEYTLNGVPADIIGNEHAAIQAIFSGKADAEIMRVLESQYLPIRIKELQELQKAGYEFVFDEVANSYILISP